MADAAAPNGPLVILGAGYAGLTVAHEVNRRSKGTTQIVLVDRHPVHVLRTELYEVGRLAEDAGNPARWVVPLARVFDRTSVEVREASVERIDLAGREVRLNSGPLAFGSLAICLGSVAAYYGVPGAAEHTQQVYRLSGAQQLAAELLRVERASGALPGERRPRIVVIGGGSTGTELAAEIATTDWTQVAGAGARMPDVVLLTGALPFLTGLPPKLVEHARAILRKSGVAVIHGFNVSRVEPGRVSLEDGSVLACDLAVWCAGLEAPALVKELPVPHGKGGRIRVDEHLFVPGHPGVVAVGDALEFADPATGLLVPGTAQAAIAEARTAAANLVAAARGEPLVPFRYRERGVIVALGLGEAAATVRRLTIWGSPAALLKRAVQRDYARSVDRGEPPSIL
jgi:NADH:ubiquinone reductase (H+-translocating)